MHWSNPYKKILSKQIKVIQQDLRKPNLNAKDWFPLRLDQTLLFIIMDMQSSSVSKRCNKGAFVPNGVSDLYL